MQRRFFVRRLCHRPQKLHFAQGNGVELLHHRRDLRLCRLCVVKVRADRVRGALDLFAAEVQKIRRVKLAVGQLAVPELIAARDIQVAFRRVCAQRLNRAVRPRFVQLRLAERFELLLPRLLHLGVFPRTHRVVKALCAVIRTRHDVARGLAELSAAVIDRVLVRRIAVPMIPRRIVDDLRLVAERFEFRLQGIALQRRAAVKREMERDDADFHLFTSLLIFLRTFFTPRLIL